jgi:hypothetical protein
MAGRDGEEPKEGVDFKWVKAENSNAKVRKFFTKADKAAMKEAPKAAEKTKPAAKAKSASKAAPKASPKPKAKPAAKAAEKATIPVDTKPTSAARDRANELGMKPGDKPKEETRNTAAMTAMGAMGALAMAAGKKPEKGPKPTGTSVARNYGSIGEGKFMGRMNTKPTTLQERIGRAVRGGGAIMAPGIKRVDDMGKGRVIPRMAKGGMVKGKKK